MCFFKEHLDLAKTKGFDDNIGRHAPPATFEVCIFHTDIIFTVVGVMKLRIL
jgi:hypothetical protein